MPAINLSEAQRTKNKTKRSVQLRGIKPPKKYEAEMRRFAMFMVKQMRERFENQVLKKLHVSTIEKFADRLPIPETGDFEAVHFHDAQIGNYAVVYDGLVKKFRKQIEKQFSEERIKKFTQKLYQNVSDYNRSGFTGTVSDKIGIDLEQVLQTDGLNSFTNAKTLQSTDMIQKLRDETIVAYKANVLRRMSAGADLRDLFDQVRKQTKVESRKADLIARNELKAFNAELSKKRAQNVGITKAVWQTAEDERVRDCHKSLNGKEYEIGKGLKDPCTGEMIEPGEQINCRCISLPIVEFE